MSFIHVQNKTGLHKMAHTLKKKKTFLEFFFFYEMKPDEANTDRGGEGKGDKKGNHFTFILEIFGWMVGCFRFSGSFSDILVHIESYP